MMWVPQKRSVTTFVHNRRGTATLEVSFLLAFEVDLIVSFIVLHEHKLVDKVSGALAHTSTKFVDDFSEFNLFFGVSFCNNFF